MKDSALIICGTREFSARVESDLHDAIDDIPRGLLIHGCAKGVDSFAAALWAARDMTHIGMPAQWDRDGNQAGPLRNEAMLDVLLALGRCGYDTAVHAFPGPNSRGTWQMAKIARDAGVQTHVYRLLLEGS